LGGKVFQTKKNYGGGEEKSVKKKEVEEGGN
jgi:hypothetical protein